MMRKRGDLYHSVRERAKEHCKWKAPKPDAPNSADMNHLPALRPLDSQLDSALELGDEGGAKTRAMFLIEADGVKICSLRFRKEAVAHRSSARALFATSSPGTAEVCPASNSATRRADSSPQSRSNSCSETSSRLSKSRCASDALASAGRESASASICVISMATILAPLSHWVQGDSDLAATAHPSATRVGASAAVAVATADEWWSCVTDPHALVNVGRRRLGRQFNAESLHSVP